MNSTSLYVGGIGSITADTIAWTADGFSVTPHEYIKRRLKEIGRDQNWLAAELGISPSGVSEIMYGKRDPRVSQLRIMADKLQVPSSLLLRLLAPSDKPPPLLLPISGKIVGNGEVVFFDRTEMASGPRVPAPDAVSEGLGFVVRTPALRGRYTEGEILWTDTSLEGDPAPLMAREAIVILADHTARLCTVLAGTKPGHYALLLLSGAVLYDQPVISGAAIEWHAPGR